MCKKTKKMAKFLAVVPVEKVRDAQILAFEKEEAEDSEWWDVAAPIIIADAENVGELISSVAAIYNKGTTFKENGTEIHDPLPSENYEVVMVVEDGRAFTCGACNGEFILEAEYVKRGFPINCPYCSTRVV